MTTPEVNPSPAIHVTNGHDLKLLNIHPLWVVGVFIVGIFISLTLMFFIYTLGMIMLLLVVWFGLGYTYYKLNKILIKVYHLIKVSETVYEWVERWEIRESVEKNTDPVFFYQMKKDLIPIIDSIEETKPFKPFSQDLNNVSSMEVALTMEQSATERLLTPVKKWFQEEAVTIFTLGLILGGLIFGIIVITGGDPPVPEIIQ